MLDPKAVLQQHPFLARALQQRAAEIIASGQYILGAPITALEQACAPWLHSRHAVAVSNGSDALLMALAALQLHQGDEVVVPAYTFVASATSVARLGARPRFIDVCPSCMTIAPHAIGNATNANTRAVMPVHLFGQAAAMAQVVASAEKQNLAVVEDAAQAFGLPALAKAINVPHLVATSFFPSKNLGACGDAGMVACGDDTLDATLRALRAHGSYSRYQHTLLGSNFRMDALQASLLGEKLAYVRAAQAVRLQNAERYRTLFVEAGAEGCALLAGCSCLAPGEDAHGGKAVVQTSPSPMHVGLPLPAARHTAPHHTYNQYVVQLRDRQARDAVVAALGAHNMGCAIYYPTPLHLQPCFRHLGHLPGDFPVAEHLAATTLALPIAEHVGKAEQARIVDVVVATLRKDAAKRQ